MVFTQPGLENDLVFLIIHFLIIYLFEHTLLERQEKKSPTAVASSAVAATLSAHLAVWINREV